ncbi:MAG: hypothetical protein JJ901_05030 [Erythrobacter sp.]|uniref:hypothetical protein n=2 Tax=Erythrobacter sp. TaxID=1042 RepID=UPI001B0652B9|nr:hypothetical protein [Erythrobacter sp.]MBO6767654.1 hypothetical protein [Erythrobacter sp.]
MASFMFRPGTLDAEFTALNRKISSQANNLEGFLGEENWISDDGSLRVANYWWADRASLDRFMRDKVHLYAKSRQSRWYDGYHVVIAEVLAAYGDGRLSHVTGDTRRQAGGKR